MEQSQLVELISTISPEERQDILSFAKLGFANHGKMKAFVAPSLEICMDYAWGEAKNPLEKGAVYAQLFPGQPFVEGKLEKAMVDALKVLRLYVSARHYCREDNSFQLWFDYAEIVRKKGLNQRFLQIIEKLRKSQADMKFKNRDFYYREYLTEYAIHDFQSQYNLLSGDINLPRTLEALELHYYINHLALINRFVLQQKVGKLETPPIIQENLQGLNVPERCLDASPDLLINYTIFQLLAKPTPEHEDGRHLFDLLLKYEEVLEKEDLRAYYTYLRNICVLIYLSSPQIGQINYTLHELYEDNLRRGFLHFEGKLHSMTYLAVSNSALKINKTDWAYHFIEKYKDELYDDNENRDYYRLVKATYLFCVGKFQECLDLIPDSSNSINYLMQGKRLTLKAYYELRSDLLSYKLDNFKMFLARTSPKILSEAQRQGNVDFANILTQIYHSAPGDTKRAALIIERIKRRKTMAEWNWLFEKAQALKGK
jgi:hypothetical protein